jgi:hypothetical protein
MINDELFDVVIWRIDTDFFIKDRHCGECRNLLWAITEASGQAALNLKKY